MCSVMSDSVILWTVARQAPLSTGFSRQEYWSGLPFPPLEGLPNPVSYDSCIGRWVLYHLVSSIDSTWKAKVAQSCPTLCDPMDYTVVEFSRPEHWRGSLSFFRGSSQPRVQTQVSHIAGQIVYQLSNIIRVNREAFNIHIYLFKVVYNFILICCLLFKTLRIKYGNVVMWILVF